MRGFAADLDAGPAHVIARAAALDAALDSVAAIVCGRCRGQQ